MTKIEEIRAVYAAREECLKNGSHTCCGDCFGLKAPRYAYNGGPYTLERKLRKEALAGDEEALDALLVLAAEDAVAAVEDHRALREAVQRLQEAGAGNVLLEEDGQFRIERIDPDYGYGYETTIVTHFGSQFSAEVLGT